MIPLGRLARRPGYTLIVSVLLLTPAPAYPHGPDGSAQGTAEPWLLAAIVATGLLYAVGTLRAWQRAGFGRGVRMHQAFLFTAGLAVLAATQLPPLHGFAESFFTGHMIEHELIMAVAAPLLVVARPLPALLAALPTAARRSGVPGWILAAGLSRSLTAPIVATTLHAAVLWFWHVPAFFAAATADPGIHAAQHAGFLLSALLFWWAILVQARRSAAIAALHLFVTMLHMGALGALIALAPAPLFPVAIPVSWGLLPLEDQQLAGIVMWVPAGLVYMGSALLLLAGWIRQAEGRSGAVNSLPGAADRFGSTR